MVTTAKLLRGQAGGLALTQKYGREHMRAIGRKGGRPRALTSADIIPSIASAPHEQGKEQWHGKSHRELLRLWRERQAASDTTGGLGAACLFNSERSSLEDSQHLGVGELDLPKNNPSSIIPPGDSTLTTTHHTQPSPQEGGEG